MSNIHIFEQAGLGKPPYKLIRVEERRYVACHGSPSQPGSSCDYCGNAIIWECWIESADGHLFKVGNECVKKSGDDGLFSPVKREVNRLKAEIRLTKENERITKGKILLDRDDIRDALATDPHPRDWMAKQGYTKLDWADWMMKNAGNNGMLQVCGVIEKLAKKSA